MTDGSTRIGKRVNTSFFCIVEYPSPPDKPTNIEVHSGFARDTRENIEKWKAINYDDMLWKDQLTPEILKDLYEFDTELEDGSLQ